MRHQQILYQAGCTLPAGRRRGTGADSSCRLHSWAAVRGFCIWRDLHQAGHHCPSIVELQARGLAAALERGIRPGDGVHRKYFVRMGSTTDASVLVCFPPPRPLSFLFDTVKRSSH